MKMIYKILTIAALIVTTSAFSANAQLYYGAKAGLNTSAASGDNSIFELGAVAGLNTSTVAVDGIGDVTNGYGYQLGATAGVKIPFIGIGIEAEALWVNNKLKMSSYGDITCNSFEIPVMVSVPILPSLPIAIKAGPSFVLYSDAKAKIAGLTADLGPVKSDVGYTVGLGVRVFKLTLDVRFNGQFKSAKVNTSDVRFNSLSASLGYRF